MEYQEIKHLLDNTPNQKSNLRTKKWVERNDKSRGTNSQIKFKPAMLKSSLWVYSDACILLKGIISIAKTAASGTAANNNNHNNNNSDNKLIFRNSTPFTNCMNCMSEINNTLVVMPKALM